MSWSGLHEGTGYLLRPDLELNYAGAWIMGDALNADDAASTSIALTVDQVSTLEIRFDPEFRIPLTESDFDPYRTNFQIEPAIFCARSTGYETDTGCGFGIELGIESRSDDQLSHFGIRAGMEEISSSERIWLSLDYERRF